MTAPREVSGGDKPLFYGGQWGNWGLKNG